MSFYRERTERTSGRRFVSAAVSHPPATSLATKRLDYNGDGGEKFMKRTNGTASFCTRSPPVQVSVLTFKYGSAPRRRLFRFGNFGFSSQIRILFNRENLKSLDYK